MGDKANVGRKNIEDVIDVSSLPHDYCLYCPFFRVRLLYPSYEVYCHSKMCRLVEERLEQFKLLYANTTGDNLIEHGDMA